MEEVLWWGKIYPLGTQGGTQSLFQNTTFWGGFMARPNQYSVTPHAIRGKQSSRSPLFSGIPQHSRQMEPLLQEIHGEKVLEIPLCLGQRAAFCIITESNLSAKKPPQIPAAQTHRSTDLEDGNKTKHACPDASPGNLTEHNTPSPGTGKIPTNNQQHHKDTNLRHSRTCDAYCEACVANNLFIN